MDIEKLIEHLRECSTYGFKQEKCRDAALAIETLRDDLARVTAERDAAVEQLHGICSACVNYSPYHNKGKCAFCVYELAREKDVEANDNWQWSGPKKEDEHEAD